LPSIFRFDAASIDIFAMMPGHAMLGVSRCLFFDVFFSFIYFHAEIAFIFAFYFRFVLR